MISFRNTAIGLAFLALHACFVSTEPLLPSGQGARIADGPVEICGEGGEDCHTATFEDDTYIVYPPPDAEDEAPLRLRFLDLADSDLGQVWLGEVELRDPDDDESIWYYGVAHPMPENTGGVTRFEMVQPDCMDATLRQAARYGIEPLDSHTCSISDIASLAAYLVEAHGEDFNDPDWWRDPD